MKTAFCILIFIIAVANIMFLVRKYTPTHIVCAIIPALTIFACVCTHAAKIETGELFVTFSRALSLVAFIWLPMSAWLGLWKVGSGPKESVSVLISAGVLWYIDTIGMPHLLNT